MYDEELKKLNDEKESFQKKIVNVDEHIKEYKRKYLLSISKSIDEVNKQIKDLGEYKGQCLHKHMVTNRIDCFNAYDGYILVDSCAVCKKELATR